MRDHFTTNPNDPKDPVMLAIAALNKKLGKAEENIGEYIDNDNAIPVCMSILKRVKNLKLWGPTGTGKTMLAMELANKLGAAYFGYQMTLDTQTYNLTTEPRIFDGETRIALNIIIQWLLYDGDAVLALHEVNFTHGGVLGLLYDLTDDQQQTYVPDLGTVVRRDSNKYLIITYNPSEKSEYAGTQALNIALTRRFEGIEVGYLPATVEMKILKKLGLSHRDADKFCQMAQFTREAYLEGELITPITLGNMKNWAKMVVEDGIEMTEILRLILGMYPQSQHGKVKKFWGTQ